MGVYAKVSSVVIIVVGVCTACIARDGGGLAEGVWSVRWADGGGKVVVVCGCGGGSVVWVAVATAERGRVVG